MSMAPMFVLSRPFAVEPVTRIMLPDGIFDNAIYLLSITCHYTNDSDRALSNVRLYLESVGDPGIRPVAETHVFPMIAPGASVRVGWMADFRNARPGKPLVSFVAVADGFSSRRSIRQIFVSETRFEAANNRYTCTVAEGTLTVSNLSAIGPAIEGWWKCDPRAPRCPPPSLGPWVPTGVTIGWIPNPAYSGVHGDLPFADPWWKVVAWVVLVIAAIVAIIAAAVGLGRASFSAGGTFDESTGTVRCCTPRVTGEFSVAGVASAIASIALIVALSDEADPFWRGQEATPPAPGERTVGEEVTARWKLPQAPNAGRPFAAEAEWTYQRFTTGEAYSHSVSETQTNVHVAGDVEVETPVRLTEFATLWVRARFKRIDGESHFVGTELYAFALFQAPGGLTFVVDLADDGIGFDPAANDGIYAGGLSLEQAYRALLEKDQEMFGTWRVYVFAQDINAAEDGAPPHIAAQHIGGVFVASALEITFDPTLPCPLRAQGTIVVG